MKKHFLLKSILLLCALIVGSGSVWAQSALWSEDFSSFSNNAVPSEGTYSYACVNGAGTNAGETKVQTQNSAGGTSPELMVGKKGTGDGAAGGSFTAVVPLANVEGSLVLKYKQNAQRLVVTTTTAGISGSGSYNTKAEQTVTFTGVTKSMTSITIVFTATTANNVRLDDIVLTVSSVEAPTFSVISGTYKTPQSVTITTNEAGGTTYYTTNGATPTNESTEYTGAIAINNTTTLKAITYKGEEKSDVTTATYTIKPTIPSFSVDAGKVAKGTSVVISQEDDLDIIYTTDGTNPSYTTPNGNLYDEPIVINRPLTIKAIAVDGYGNESNVKSVSYGLSFPGMVEITPNFTFFGKAAQFSGSTYSEISGTKNGVVITNTRNSASLYANASAMRFYAGNTLKIDAPSGKTITEVIFTIDNNETDNIQSMPTGYLSPMWEGDASSITFTRPSGSYLSISNIDVVLADKVTIGASKYASYCSNSILDFTETDVKAYIAKVDEGKVVLTQIDKVPAEEGIILYGNEGDYTVPAAASASAVSENELVGVTVETSVVWNPSSGVYNYILQQGTFKKASDGKLRANRAYLQTSYDVTSPGAHDLEMVFDGELGDVTGISEIKKMREGENETFYNLAGQRVSANHKGLVIVNGKKYLNK